MAVTPFIPIQRVGRPNVKSHAILTFGQAGTGRARLRVVTADRPRPVGRPTIGARSDRDAPVESLIGDAVAAGRERLELLQVRARQAVRAFRWRRDVEGRQTLASVIEGVQALLHLATAAAEATGCELDTFAAGNRVLAATRQAAHALVVDQRSGDWHVLADTLERQLLPALGGWRVIFDLLESAPFDPTPSTPHPGGFAA